MITISSPNNSFTLKYVGAYLLGPQIEGDKFILYGVKTSNKSFIKTY